MLLVELLYKAKKSFIQFYKKYFTTEGTYTCILPDKIYLKKLYKQRTGKKLNLRNPKTFNEKQNWLKLYDRRPEYTVMVDKYKAREYIAEKIGEEYLVPLLGVWDSPDEIDFDALPNEFVLKCNHDNGVIICRDKSKLDIEKTKEELRYRLSRDYYKKLREWPYKNVQRKIICEEFLENVTNEPFLEYNVFCFNGIPRFIKIGSVLSDGTHAKDFYDTNWNYLDLKTGYSQGNIFAKPIYFDTMIDVSKRLSEDVCHIRVDFFDCNDNLYNGELTFFSNGGFMHFNNEKWNLIWGESLSLPKKHRR